MELVQRLRDDWRVYVHLFPTINSIILSFQTTTNDNRSLYSSSTLYIYLLRYEHHHPYLLSLLS